MKIREVPSPPRSMAEHVSEMTDRELAENQLLWTVRAAAALEKITAVIDKIKVPAWLTRH